MLSRARIFFGRASTLHPVDEIFGSGYFFAQLYGLCVGLGTGMVSCGYIFLYLVSMEHTMLRKKSSFLISLKLDDIDGRNSTFVIKGVAIINHPNTNVMVIVRRDLNKAFITFISC